MAVQQKPTGHVPPLLKNANSAPMIYFDAVPVFGAFAGHIEVEVAARILMPKDDTTVIAEMLCVAHLRCSPQAAEALTDALDKAIDMHTKQMRGLEN